MFEVPEHTCDVVKIKLESHPNADSLSLVRIDDFQCAVRTEGWKDGDLAVYIPSESVVPETEEFAFLGKHRRIKVQKIRGKYSAGLLIHAPSGDKVGDDCMEQLGIVHYEPLAKGDFSTDGENVKPPRVSERSKGGLFTPVYDVLNFRKYSHLFEDGEEIIVTEKLHGTSARFVCIDDTIYCGSRRFWKKETTDNLWWKALKQYMVLEAWLRHNQELIVYSEIFGQVQTLKYGATGGQIFFAAFDILKGTQWLDFDEAHTIGSPLPWVPLVYRGPFDKERILEFAEGDSSWPGAHHYREGVVVKPVHERTDPKIGRVQLKVVGNRYLSKS
jgi:RNA ligase (TIGR02306 family)